MDVTWWQDKHESHNMPHQLMTVEDSSSKQPVECVEATAGTISAPNLAQSKCFTLINKNHINRDRLTDVLQIWLYSDFHTSAQKANNWNVCIDFNNGRVSTMRAFKIVKRTFLNGELNFLGKTKKKKKECFSQTFVWKVGF